MYILYHWKLPVTIPHQSSPQRGEWDRMGAPVLCVLV